MVSTLTTYPDVEQRSDEWHKLRLGMVTASTVKNLLTPTLKVAANETSRAATLALVAERITGVTESSFMNDDMWRGVMHEPFARDYYAQHHSPVAEIGFMVRTWNDAQIGCSPDGLVGDDGLIEIKCPRAKEHVRTILADEVPGGYMAQLQTALLVSGRDWIDYVSFCAGLPLWVKRVTPDPDWHDAILEAARRFEDDAAELMKGYGAMAFGLPTTERIEEVEMTF